MARINSLILRLPLPRAVKHQLTDRELIGLAVILSLILVGHGLQ